MEVCFAPPGNELSGSGLVTKKSLGGKGGLARWDERSIACIAASQRSLGRAMLDYTNYLLLSGVGKADEHGAASRIPRMACTA